MEEKEDRRNRIKDIESSEMPSSMRRSTPAINPNIAFVSFNDWKNWYAWVRVLSDAGSIDKYVDLQSIKCKPSCLSCLISPKMI